MTMRDLLPVASFVAIFIVILTLVLVAVNRRAKVVNALLHRIAEASGWTNLQNLFFASTGVRGTWRQFPAELAYRQRQKGAPQRLVVRIEARSDAQLIIKRKFDGVFSNRPLTWFGPPLIEVHQPSAAQVWVRGDPSLAERIFADSKLASMIGTNLIARFDELKVDARGLRITRSLDSREAKAKYDIPTFALSGDVNKFEPIAREQIELAEAMVGKLAT